MGRRAIIRCILAVVACLVLVAAGLAVWAWREGGSSTEVSEAGALAAFRESTTEAPRRPHVPAPGVYTYAQRGSEQGSLGPASVSRRLPPAARYVITLTDAGYQEELSLAAEHVEAVRFTVSGGASHAVWRRTDITFVGLGRDDRRDLVPPPLQYPARLAVGVAWSSTYHAGDLPVSSRSVVVRRERVMVGSTSLPALVVRTVGDTGGVHPGRRVDTVWWSPKHSLPLRWVIDMEVHGVAQLTTRTQLRLTSTAPTV